MIRTYDLNGDRVVVVDGEPWCITAWTPEEPAAFPHEGRLYVRRPDGIVVRSNVLLPPEDRAWWGVVAGSTERTAYFLDLAWRRAGADADALAAAWEAQNAADEGADGAR